MAYMWHSPFRVAEKVSEFAVRLEIAGTDYRVLPVVYLSKIKPVRQYPVRTTSALVMDEEQRFNFDEEPLPGDNWSQIFDEGEYEVEKISDMRSGRRTRFGRTYREFLVH